MQILNISTTVRPSDSLTTRMFPVTNDHINARYDIKPLPIVLRTLVHEGNHELSAQYNITNVGVVLREPLINLSARMGATQYSVKGAAITLRDTLVTFINRKPSAVNYTVSNPTIILQRVLITATVSKPIGAARYNVANVTATLT